MATGTESTGTMPCHTDGYHDYQDAEKFRQPVLFIWSVWSVSSV